MCVYFNKTNVGVSAYIMAQAALGNSKLIQDINNKLRMLSVEHNKLTTMFLLLSQEVVKIKKHTNYTDPEPEETKQPPAPQQQPRTQTRGKSSKSINN